MGRDVLLVLLDEIDLVQAAHEATPIEGVDLEPILKAVALHCLRLEVDCDLGGGILLREVEETRLDSRSMSGRPFEYRFYLDFAVEHDPRVAEMRLLGTYPTGLAWAWAAAGSTSDRDPRLRAG